jgi:hypothetical protein
MYARKFGGGRNAVTEFQLVSHRLWVPGIYADAELYVAGAGNRHRRIEFGNNVGAGIVVGT